MGLRFGLIGGLGVMASPMAIHWAGYPDARIIRIHDRGNTSEKREAARNAWKKYGAKTVNNFADLVGNGDLDGVIICAGKNGDDCSIITEIGHLLSQTAKPSAPRPIILHLSTVSTGFARAAHKFATALGVDYVNYPLTGGSKGAQTAQMLILAAGDKNIFDRLEPSLSKLGKPKYFSPRPDAGAEVKFISHLMVFGGLLGISSAVAVHSDGFQDGVIGGADQIGFFDFLNTGAGGTRQWDLSMGLGIKQNIWDAAFAISYAAIDAIYAVQLCAERGTSRLATDNVIRLILAFAYILHHVGDNLATQSIVREMIEQRANAMDQFIARYYDPKIPLDQMIERCILALPEKWQAIAGLRIGADDFIMPYSNLTPKRATQKQL